MAQTSAPVKLSHLAVSDDILKECSAVEIALEELKAAYEQYFLGIERLPPVKQHQTLRKRFEQLRSTFNRTTSVRFRVQSLSSKVLSYERLWQRTMEEIENGTYKRDLFKARLHAHKKRPPPNGAKEQVPQAQPANPPAQSGPPAQLSDTKLRAVYAAYLAAKRRCGEDVSKLSFESVASKLRKQVPHILEKHKVSAVEFKILVKDGKAVLRAVPAAPPNGDES
jgi:hypothetical protein